MATLDSIPAGQGLPGRPHDRCRTMDRSLKQKGSEMNRFLSRIAWAAMLLVFGSVPLRAEDVTPPAADQPAHITLAIASIGCPAHAPFAG